MEYLREPHAISRMSSEIIRREADLSHLPPDLAPLAVRLIHSCGMVDIAGALAFDPRVGVAGRAALDAGAPILVDSRMVGSGITRAFLPRGNAVICRLDDDRVADLARVNATTRSAAAVTLWRGDLNGAVVAIGNAPTALFRLLELLDDGAPKPAAILAFPVGFVGAAESKQALAADPRGVPFVTLLGRRGGSAMAAAAVNALAAGEPA
ncbi:MAG: precorrin-8X methylmutase [Rhodospirillaceae bacterium]|nr:precorrin-8X methylmutase [Rhodospirillaceae bacterium]